MAATPTTQDTPAAAAGFAARLPRWLLGIEGLAALVAALIAYGTLGGSWLVFIALLLTPDLAFVAYLRGPRAGAVCYNLVHTYTLPLALLGIGWALSQPEVVLGALIWLAHVGMDRAVGYGLKYPTNAKDNHLKRV